MGSTLRNDTRAAIFLERIAKAWDKRHDLSFGQLLYEALQDDDQPRRLAPDEEEDEEALAMYMRMVLKLRRLEDTQIAELIERFVLTRS